MRVAVTRVPLLIIVSLVSINSARAKDVCQAAFWQPSSPLVYREPKAKVSDQPYVYDTADFRKIESHGLQLENVMKMKSSERAEAERDTAFTIEFGPRPEKDPQALKLLETEFEEISAIVDHLYWQPFTVPQKLIQDIAMDAVAKAARLLRGKGIGVEILYEPKTRETYLMIAIGGEHPVNKAMVRFWETELPLIVAYRPSEQIRNRFTAMLDPNEILYLSKESILRQSVRETTILHELRHWKNRLNKKRKLSYSLYGASLSLGGLLPGPRDAYARQYHHDEPHTYFETLKQSIIEAIKSSKETSTLETFSLIHIARTGYRVSYRNEALARIILGGAPRELTFYLSKSRVVSAHIEYLWGRNRIATDIPLVSATPSMSVAAKLELLDQQLKWMRDTSAKTKDLFDQAHQALVKMQDAPTVEALRKIQSDLQPVNYSVHP